MGAGEVSAPGVRGGFVDEEVTTQKWLFRLADQCDYSAAGIRPQEAPAAVPGRCIVAGTRLQTHVATPGTALPTAVAGEPWLIPVGIREADLEPQYLELYEASTS